MFSLWFSQWIHVADITILSSQMREEPWFCSKFRAISRTQNCYLCSPLMLPLPTPTPPSHRRSNSITLKSQVKILASPSDPSPSIQGKQAPGMGPSPKMPFLHWLLRPPLLHRLAEKACVCCMSCPQHSGDTWFLPVLWAPPGFSCAFVKLRRWT